MNLLQINQQEAFRYRNRASLVGQDLSNRDLSNIILNNASFDCATLNNTNLKRTSLQQTSFFSADLEGAKLSYAEINNCDFRHANLEKADLEGVDFSNSDVRGAIFTDAKGLSFEQKIWLKNNGALNISLEKERRKSSKKFNFRSNLKSLFLYGKRFGT